MDIPKAHRHTTISKVVKREGAVGVRPKQWHWNQVCRSSVVDRVVGAHGCQFCSQRKSWITYIPELMLSSNCPTLFWDVTMNIHSLLISNGLLHGSHQEIALLITKCGGVPAVAMS